MSLSLTIEVLTRKVQAQGFVAGLALLLAVQPTSATLAQDGIDPVTGFAREPVHVAAWPGGRKVAVSFALFVEEFGLGQGPVFRPDLATRNPDLVNEAFRQYGIDWGIARVGRLFKELDVPLSIVLECRVSRRPHVGVEGVPGGAAECAHNRPWFEQHQPYAAARARASPSKKPTSAGRWT